MALAPLLGRIENGLGAGAFHTDPVSITVAAVKAGIWPLGALYFVIVLTGVGHTGFIIEESVFLGAL